MPKASDHSARGYSKRLFIGDSGTGKTTALWSLAKAGKKLRIIDFDNLLDPLIIKTRMECPEYLDNIEFMSFRDKLRSTEMGPVVDGMPRALTGAIGAMYKWEDGTKPAEWGSDYVLVIDSLTTMSRAAFFWAKGQQGAAGLPDGVPAKGVDPRAIYHTGQQAIINVIDAITSDNFKTNVIVIAHVKYIESDNRIKGYPNALGTAIAPEIPAYFASVSLADKNASGQRVIRTRSTNMIDLKDPKTFDPKFASELPMETGLAELFK